jgi:hypothetical protein
MATAQNIKYINQREFLDNLDYASIKVSDSVVDEKNTFEVYQGKAAVVKDVRGVSVYKELYECEIFNICNEDYDFSQTYFSKKNVNGFSLMDLKENEIIISYDTAKRLKVKAGDVISFIKTASGARNERIEFVIKGIMQTKYKYEQIGNIGTVIIRMGDTGRIKQFFQSIKYYTFTGEENGTITKKAELNNCNFLELPTESVLVVNVIFPCAGLVLVLLILHREMKRVIAKMNYNYSVLVSIGMEKKEFLKGLMVIEGNIFILSIIGALLLYKYVLMQKLIGEFISYKTLVIFFCILSIIGLISVFFSVKRMQNYIDKIDLVANLCRKDDFV